MAIRRIDSLGYQLGLLNRLYDRCLQDALKEFGVAPGQFAPLVMLFEEDGLTQAELCRRINVEQPTMANTLDRMERDGLIKRKADTDDRRRSHVFLTSRAKDIQTQVMEAARAVSNRTVTRMSAGEQDDMFRLVARMVENLKS
ncbi:MAG: MarR family transcriptional regulator [Rhodospirillaceae bacterium]|nr:MarR family transcriptional regulator [Rhodospirillaceae bacterium]